MLPQPEPQHPASNARSDVVSALTTCCRPSSNLLAWALVSRKRFLSCEIASVSPGYGPSCMKFQVQGNPTGSPRRSLSVPESARGASPFTGETGPGRSCNIAQLAVIWRFRAEIRQRPPNRTPSGRRCSINRKTAAGDGALPELAVSTPDFATGRSACDEDCSGNWICAVATHPKIRGFLHHAGPSTAVFRINDLFRIIDQALARNLSGRSNPHVETDCLFHVL